MHSPYWKSNEDSKCTRFIIEPKSIYTYQQRVEERVNEKTTQTESNVAQMVE